jgi:hypothetical protein
MAWYEMLFAAAVALVALPAALRSRTALALAASWAVQEAVCLASGGAVDTLTGLVLDYSVIVVLLTQPFRTRWEMAVAAIFLPIMWGVHALLDPWHQLVGALVAGAGAVACSPATVARSATGALEPTARMALHLRKFVCTVAAGASPA